MATAAAPTIGQPPTGLWRRVEPILALAVALAGLAYALWLVHGSLDYFYHDDDITHYRFALKGWFSAEHRWHVWGRPGYTIPTMVVAHYFGLTGCRVFSALQMTGVAYLAYLIARRLGAGRSAFLAPALVWVQPLAMTLSLTTLTETPAALYLALTVWLYLRGNYVWSCAAMSLLFVTRYETLALAPILAVGIIYQALKANEWSLGRALKTRWLWAAAGAMLWAPAVYVAFSCYHLWMGHITPSATPLSLFAKKFGGQYGSGEWWYYLLLWPVAAGAGVLVLGAAGLASSGRKGLMVCTLGLGLVGLHTVIYRYGMFESGGYPRFLVTGAVLYAAVAASGLEALLNGRRLPAALAFAAIGGFLFALDVAARNQQLWLLFPGRDDQQLQTIYSLVGMAGTLMFVAFGLGAIFLLFAIPEVYRDLRGAAAPPAGRGAMLVGALTGLAALAAVTGIATQARLQIEPLSPYGDPHRYVITQAVKYVNAQPDLAGRHAYGAHPMLDILRPNTDVTWSGPNDGMRLWKEAKPGTLYFWDNKYCGKPEGDDGRLEDSLNALGRLVFREAYNDDPCSPCVQVYIKLTEEELKARDTLPPPAPTTSAGE